MILWSACDTRRTAGEHERAAWRNVAIRPAVDERALVPHDPKHMVDLYQDVREDDRRRQMLHKDIVIDAEVAVI